MKEGWQHPVLSWAWEKVMFEDILLIIPCVFKYLAVCVQMSPQKEIFYLQLVCKQVNCKPPTRSLVPEGTAADLQCFAHSAAAGGIRCIRGTMIVLTL